MNNRQRLSRFKSRMLAIIAPFVFLAIICLIILANINRISKNVSGWKAQNEKITQAEELK